MLLIRRLRPVPDPGARHDPGPLVTAEPGRGSPWDLVVVGGGTAGIVGAKTAARFGASVLLVEEARTGGDCLWTGCVPSKSLLAAADVAASARAGGRFGIVADVAVDFAAVMEHVRAAIAHIAPIDSPEALEDAGVTVLAGRARFTGPRRLVVGDREVEFTQALVATGAAPVVPPIDGLDGVRFLTSETVWDLEELPPRLVVLGGGSIGCELGQAFSRLGSQVTVVEGAPRLLPHEDHDAADLVSRALAADGAEVVTGADVVAVSASTGSTSADGAEAGTEGGSLHLSDGRRVAFSHLLVSVGRAPRTSDLGLADAGVELDERGHVQVDDRLRTTNHRIWAAGDLTGYPQFTHTAGVHGSLAASNAVLGVRRTVDVAAVPRVTYTQPEVAAVGASTSDPATDHRVRTLRHEHVDRAVAEARTAGYTRLAIDRRGRVVGATVVGPRAGETLGELGLAIRQGMRTRDLAAVTHAYPTWNDGAWNAAIADLRDRLESPGPTAWAIGALSSSRRWWLRRKDR